MIGTDNGRHSNMASVVETSQIPNRTPPEANQQIKFHASLNVSNLAKSLEFYTALLGMPPVKAYEDYAKFEIDVPPLVLSLKPKRACAGGPLNHLGLRVTSLEQLERIHERLKLVGARIGQQDDVKCCYALQSKLWITDPDETLWEVYVLHDDVPDWGEKHKKIKLLSAPLKAFGIRGVIRRWWNNAYGERPQAVEPRDPDGEDSAIPLDACPTNRSVDPSSIKK
jgi:catechol 2,3-dioxygenase-like lactoylglutathione lyase family enzyme